VNGRDWWIPKPPKGRPSLRGQLHAALDGDVKDAGRWALLTVLLVINGIGVHWVWTAWGGRQHAASLVAGLLGAVGLGLLDLVAVVLVLYAWGGRPSAPFDSASLGSARDGQGKRSRRRR